MQTHTTYFITSKIALAVGLLFLSFILLAGQVEAKETKTVTAVNKTNSGSDFLKGRNLDGFTSDVKAQIDALLKQIQDLKKSIEEHRPGTGQTQQPNTPSTVKKCFDFGRPLFFGYRDKNNERDVRDLQEFLAQEPDVYPEGEITGYFGQATQRAVQKYQAKHNIVTSGTPESTGFGVVGKKTLDFFKKNCVQQKDIFKIQHINKITVTTRDSDPRARTVADLASVVVDMSTTSDITFSVASTTRAKIINLIGNQLDKEYRFSFSSFATGTARNTALAALTTFKHATSSCLTNSSASQNDAHKKCGKNFVLSDVTKITYKELTKGHNNYNNKKRSVQYTITLVDGLKRTVVREGTATSSVSEQFTKALRKIGYTGDVAALLAKATAEVVVDPNAYGLTDVKTITVRTIDPNKQVADEEYSRYTITLNSGKTRKVKVFMHITVEARNKAFNDSGYTGDVPALIAKAVTTNG